jgi:deaminated glutathione amidase
MPVTVAAAQFAAGTDKDANLKALHDGALAAVEQGAALMVAPEDSMFTSPDPTADLSGVAETLDGAFATEVAALAAETGLTIVAGMTERLADDDRVSNTVLAVDGRGERIGVYRKLHLYDAFGYQESLRVRPADHADPLIFTVGGLSFGVMTCYDLRFPEQARSLVDAGAQALLVPAAWASGPAKEDHWSTLLRARAIESTVYVVGAGQTAPRCTGHSMIVDPMGVVRANAGEEPAVASAQLSTERLDTVRAKLPSLSHRRFRVVPG